MKFVTSLILLISSLSLYGCHGGDGFSPEAPPSFAPPSQANLDTTDAKISDWTTKYYASNDPAEQQQLRNDIVDAVMGIIDNRFLAFDEGLWRNRNMSDFAFDMTNIALGLTGTIVGGTETKTVTNALVTVVTGTKTGINSDFYNQQTAMAISSKMKALRSAQAAVISSHRTDGVDKYPLAPDALQDLISYYRDGTVLGALQDITSTSGADSKTNANINNLVQSSSGPAANPSNPTTHASGDGSHPTTMGAAGTTAGGSQGSGANTPNKYMIMRDAAGRLHLFNSTDNAEVKFDANGIPITTK